MPIRSSSEIHADPTNERSVWIIVPLTVEASAEAWTLEIKKKKRIATPAPTPCRAQTAGTLISGEM